MREACLQGSSRATALPQTAVTMMILLALASFKGLCASQPMPGYDAFATREHALGPGVGLLLGAASDDADVQDAHGHERKDDKPSPGPVSPLTNSVASDAWVFSSDSHLCRLEQALPIARVRFVHMVDGAAYFELLASVEVTGTSADILVASTKVASARARSIGAVVLRKGETTRATNTLALAIFAALRQGKLVSIAPSGDAAQALPLSGKNFAAAYADYRNCLLQLSPVTLAQVERATVHFAVNKAVINPRDARLLDRLAENMVENTAKHSTSSKGVARIVVDGHTDSTGSLRHNDALSKARANATRAYLQAHGVDKAKLLAHGHAYRVPVASNKTQQGRALNRRATVRLVRGEAGSEDVTAKVAGRPDERAAGSLDDRGKRLSKDATVAPVAKTVPVNAAVSVVPTTAPTPAAPALAVSPLTVSPPAVSPLTVSPPSVPPPALPPKVTAVTKQ